MNSKIEGIEYLRAIMSVLVVAWHMGLGGQSSIFSRDMYLEHTFTISDFINFHILLIAVPSFIFISIFLYASRGPKPMLTKRLRRILILLSFWPIAFILYNSGYQGLYAIIPDSPTTFLYITLRAGNTIYYYFIGLFVCILIAHYFMKFNLRIQIVTTLSWIIFLAFLPLLTKLTGFHRLSAYWNPLNFISLSLAAVLVAQNKNTILENRKIVILTSIGLSVLFSIFEWKYSVGKIFFWGNGYAFPAYTRPSLLFTVLPVFIIALNPHIKANAIITFMAKYSLALYCLHPFFMRPVRTVMAIFIQNGAYGKYLSFFIVITISYSIAALLKTFYLKEEVLV